MTQPDYFNYHWQRTVKNLQDALDRATTSRERVQISRAIEGLLYAQLTREESKKL